MCVFARVSCQIISKMHLKGPVQLLWNNSKGSRAIAVAILQLMRIAINSEDVVTKWFQALVVFWSELRRHFLDNVHVRLHGPLNG